MSHAREAKGKRGSKDPYWDPRVRPYLKWQAELVFSSLCPDLEEIGNLREDTDCSNPASRERWAGGSRRARGAAAAAARGVEGGEGVRSGGDGRRRRKRRRGKRWQERAG